MQKLLMALLFLACLFPLPARDVSGVDLAVSHAAIYDCALAVSAGYVATPRYYMPGCTLGEGPLPTTLTFKESDLGSYLACIPAQKEQASWYQRLALQVQGPLDNQARTYFTVHDWKENDILITGNVRILWPLGASVKTVVAKALLRQLDPINVELSLLLEGSRISFPVCVTGNAIVQNEGINIQGLDFHYGKPVE